MRSVKGSGSFKCGESGPLLYFYWKRQFEDLHRVGAGVIGTGFWGENQVRVLRQNPKCNLLGICDSNRERARQVGSKYSVPWYTDTREFLRIPEIEAVTVATPTHTHFQVGTEILEAGKKFLVGKPTTGNKGQAGKPVTMAPKNGFKVMGGFIERFNPRVLVFKKLYVPKTA